MRIGLDLDNTLVDYGQVFGRLAQPYLSSDEIGDKQNIRAAIRALPDGENIWQRLQGQAYGPMMQLAKPFPGVGEFLKRAESHGAELWIVSHKTMFGHADDSKTNLRRVALDWLRNQGFLAGQKPSGLSFERVFFENDQNAKVARIRSLALDYFVDDLAEVFRHPAFPNSVRAILFSQSSCPELPFVDAMGDWASISRALLP